MPRNRRPSGHKGAPKRGPEEKSAVLPQENESAQPEKADGALLEVPGEAAASPAVSADAGAPETAGTAMQPADNVSDADTAPAESARETEPAPSPAQPEKEPEKPSARKFPLPRPDLPALRRGLVRFGKGVRRTAVRNNAVLIRVLAICTVLGATTALKNGLLLSIAAAAVTIPLYLIMTPLCRKLPAAWQAVATVLIAGAIVTPVCMLAGYLAPEVTASAGVFLPITAINAALMCETVRPSGRGMMGRALVAAVGDVLVAAVGDVLAFSVVVIVLSALREVFGSGTLYGRPIYVLTHLRFEFLLQPPGAFLLLGLIFAALQGWKLKKRRRGGETK